MSAWSAWIAGMRRVTRAPVVLLSVWLVTLLFSLPLALDVRGDIERQLGSSLDAAGQTSGVSYDWLSEFGDQATGVSSTVAPTVIGFAAVVDNLSAFLDRDARPIVVAATGVAYALLWLFLAGGLIDRFARNRPTRTHAFFQACGGYFFRLLRLSMMAGVFYWVLLERLHPWLLDHWFDRFTEDLESERAAFAIRLALYAVFIVALAAVNLWFDYAKVRLVVEDRGSALGALRAAGRLVARTAPGAVALYLLDAALFLLVLLAYAIVAPGARSTWFAFIAGQLYIGARLWVKLVFWASVTVRFQGQLAHAGYTARPVPAWPGPAAAGGGESRYTLLSVRPPTEAP